jgi:branched-chain amino acid transport system ATP-binding protein
VTTILETRNVSKFYGPFCALESVSMSLKENEILAIVGPNGAGKTTLVNLLTGLAAPTTGEVLLRGATIAGASPVELAERGVARSFQLVQIFPKLTVA